MVVTQESTQTAIPAIPSYLVYEVLNGRPLYYRGYKEVLEKNLNPESIMGSSALQSILVSLIYGHVLNNRDKKKYIPVTNEAGVHMALTDNLSCDVAIFEKGTFAVTTKYFDVAPKIVVEVDVKIDLADFDGIEFNYVAEKNQRLFDFGVERVLWVLSKHRRVMIAVPNQDWIFTDWSNDITVMEGCVLNIKKLLEEEEISY
ncbi:Uma2 family endonuclease [Spirosoma validum]|uniref:Uma2 family endonuclease n=1 Tax=Spirosoma validum TaxID=2771355 RepID=A0A927GH87_9BACT|nr:Uma2 family endonuclease [Spirosoma validum]MBD2757674.1 Uma2 family endonuclease [Spirosoma validum]